MKHETITWHELPADGMPDAEVTVLAEIRDHKHSEATEVWPAFWGGESWVDAGRGMDIEAGRVLAWADVPVGVACPTS